LQNLVSICALICRASSCKSTSNFCKSHLMSCCCRTDGIMLAACDCLSLDFPLIRRVVLYSSNNAPMPARINGNAFAISNAKIVFMANYYNIFCAQAPVCWHKLGENLFLFCQLIFDNLHIPVLFGRVYHLKIRV